MSRWPKLSAKFSAKLLLRRNFLEKRARSCRRKKICASFGCWIPPRNLRRKRICVPFAAACWYRTRTRARKTRNVWFQNASRLKDELEAMRFGWRVVKHVKSNAIVYSAPDRTLAIGAGQMSRVDSSRIAIWKAQEAGLSLKGSAIASDAFFPFADGLIAAADAGATCAIQPGGSMRDEEVIAAADERDMAMIFTGVRHFRH